MECPFELPVRAYYGDPHYNDWCVADANGQYLFCGQPEADALYIAAAINGYGKMREALEAALRVKKLWLPKGVYGAANADEQAALCTMHEMFQQALKETEQ